MFSGSKQEQLARNALLDIDVSTDELTFDRILQDRHHNEVAYRPMNDYDNTNNYSLLSQPDIHSNQHRQQDIPSHSGPLVAPPLRTRKKIPTLHLNGTATVPSTLVPPQSSSIERKTPGGNSMNTVAPTTDQPSKFSNNQTPLRRVPPNSNNSQKIELSVLLVPPLYDATRRSSIDHVYANIASQYPQLQSLSQSQYSTTIADAATPATIGTGQAKTFLSPTYRTTVKRHQQQQQQQKQIPQTLQQELFNSQHLPQIEETQYQLLQISKYQQQSHIPPQQLQIPQPMNFQKWVQEKLANSSSSSTQNNNNNFSGLTTTSGGYGGATHASTFIISNNNLNTQLGSKENISDVENMLNKYNTATNQSHFLNTSSQTSICGHSFTLANEGNKLLQHSSQTVTAAKTSSSTTNAIATPAHQHTNMHQLALELSRIQKNRQSNTQSPSKIQKSSSKNLQRKTQQEQHLVIEDTKYIDVFQKQKFDQTSEQFQPKLGFVSQQLQSNQVKKKSIPCQQSQNPSLQFQQQSQTQSLFVSPDEMLTRNTAITLNQLLPTFTDRETELLRKSARGVSSDTHNLIDEGENNRRKSNLSMHLHDDHASFQAQNTNSFNAANHNNNNQSELNMNHILPSSRSKRDSAGCSSQLSNYVNIESLLIAKNANPVGIVHTSVPRKHYAKTKTPLKQVYLLKQQQSQLSSDAAIIFNGGNSMNQRSSDESTHGGVSSMVQQLNSNTLRQQQQQYLKTPIKSDSGRLQQQHRFNSQNSRMHRAINGGAMTERVMESQDQNDSNFIATEGPQKSGRAGLHPSKRGKKLAAISTISTISGSSSISPLKNFAKGVAAVPVSGAASNLGISANSYVGDVNQQEGEHALSNGVTAKSGINMSINGKEMVRYSLPPPIEAQPNSPFVTLTTQNRPTTKSFFQSLGERKILLTDFSYPRKSQQQPVGGGVTGTGTAAAAATVGMLTGRSDRINVDELMRNAKLQYIEETPRSKISVSFKAVNSPNKLPLISVAQQIAKEFTQQIH